VSLSGETNEDGIREASGDIADVGISLMLQLLNRIRDVLVLGPAFTLIVSLQP
jgi:hypothetical protein